MSMQRSSGGAPVTESARDYSVLADDSGFLFARINARSLAIVGAALVPFGLKPRSYSILRLATTAEPPTQRDLARILELDPSQIVALVDGLESAGYVRRQQSESDRRSNAIVATEEGARVAETAAESVRGAHAQVFRALGAAEQEELHRMLLAIAISELEEES